jgi:hypothetical protein
MLISREVHESSTGAEMQRIGLLLFGVIVLAFCGVVYVAYLSWRKMAPWKRIASLSCLHHIFCLWYASSYHCYVVTRLKDRLVSIPSFSVPS